MKNKIDRELILQGGIFSFILAIGILFVGLFFFGIDVKNCELTYIVGIYAMLVGGIWTVILCRNC